MNTVFDALADPNRRKILELLKEKDRCVSDILEHFSFRQASLSHHLKVLKDAELVKAQRRWQYMYYSLNKEALLEAIKLLSKLLGFEEEATTKESEI